MQILTPGGAGGDVKRNDLILLTPGGGVGPLSTGCTAQYGNGFSWYVTPFLISKKYHWGVITLVSKYLMILILDTK